MPLRRPSLALVLRALLAGAALVTLLVARRPEADPGAAALRVGPPPATAPAAWGPPLARVALALLILGALVADQRRRRAWH